MIVSNTSPLIVLKRAGATRVLTEIFQEIYIPPAVWAELKVREEEFFKGMRQLRIKEVGDRLLVEALTLTVDLGEAEAITLALETEALLLIDDLKGRRTARKMGVRVIGSLGVLALAKNRGLIDSVKPYVERLLAEGYYLNKKLIEEFLKAMGEA